MRRASPTQAVPQESQSGRALSAPLPAVSSDGHSRTFCPRAVTGEEEEDKPTPPSGPTPESASNSSRLVFEVLEQTGTDGTRWVRLLAATPRRLRQGASHMSLSHPQRRQIPTSQAHRPDPTDRPGLLQTAPPPAPPPREAAGQQRKDIMSRPLPISEHLGGPPPPHPAHGRSGRRELTEGSRL